MSRLNSKDIRLLINGLELSGDVLNLGQLGIEYTTNGQACLNHEIKGVLIGKPSLIIDPINGILNSEIGAEHEVALELQGGVGHLIVCIGDDDEPEEGDLAAVLNVSSKNYQMTESEPYITFTYDFGSPKSGELPTGKIWGFLLHGNSSAVVVNAGSGVDNAEAKDAGCLIGYQVLDVEGSGSFTVKVEHSTNRSTWTELASVELDSDDVPLGGYLVPAGLTVNRYLRWQIDLGDVDSIQFVLAIVVN